MSSYAHYLTSSDVKMGARVKIVRQLKYKRFDLIGKIGVIRSSYGSNLAVEFDDIRNPASVPGYFYLLRKDFVVVDDNDNVMEENNMTKITNYLNLVKIQFLDSASPCECVYANFDYDLKEGDLCVVKPAHHPMTLAKVVKFYDEPNLEPQREIVARVDTQHYDDRIQARKRVAEIKAKMEARATQLQDIALYQMLAKEDPDMQELLAEYQALPKM